MPYPTKSDYIERGASVPSWAGGPSNTDLPESEGPRACPECGCHLENHHFKADYQAFAAALINDEPDFYLERAPNPCAECDACPRDEEGN